MRAPLFQGSAIGRVAPFALAAAAIVAAGFALGRDGPAEIRPVGLKADPLAAALARCQALGALAQGDAACEAAWAENRRRFFAGEVPLTVKGERPAVAEDR